MGCRKGVILLATAALVLGAPAFALAAAAPGPLAWAGSRGHSVLQSRRLWATIDVCNAPGQPDTVGIRGSMPGNGQAHDEMYMRFRLQYMDATTKQWVDLGSAADTGPVAVGAAKSVRQAGTSFELKRVKGKPPFTLRGVVTFQWRDGSTVVISASRPTSAGRVSLAGADPAGFSAATCVIG